MICNADSSRLSSVRIFLSGDVNEEVPCGLFGSLFKRTTMAHPSFPAVGEYLCIPSDSMASIAIDEYAKYQGKKYIVSKIEWICLVGRDFLAKYIYIEEVKELANL